MRKQSVFYISYVYTYESSWILETAADILRNFAEADCRAAWLIASDEKGARDFLGPLATEFLTLCDPDKELISEIGCTHLPALAHLDNSRQVAGLSNGWNPEEWREITDKLATTMSWSRPVIPKTGDPVPFEGTKV